MPLSRDELMEFLASLPWKMSKNGYAIIKRAHVVLWADGRPLGPKQIAHHINENKSDDRPENLQVVTWSEHAKIHGHGERAKKNMAHLRTPEVNEKRRLKSIGNKWNLGRKMTDEQRAAHSENMRQVWKERRGGKRDTPDVFNHQERKNQLLQ